MKNLLFVALFGLALIFSSCGADQATVDACADDMCKIMEKYNPEDPMSALDIIGPMTELMEKDGYSGVTEPQLKKAMGEKCPEGLKKMEDMTAGVE
jgi:hypothetical protein